MSVDEDSTGINMVYALPMPFKASTSQEGELFLDMPKQIKKWFTFPNFGQGIAHHDHKPDQCSAEGSNEESSEEEERDEERDQPIRGSCEFSTAKQGRGHKQLAMRGQGPHRSSKAPTTAMRKVRGTPKSL